jgi:hypothetical protein
VNCPPFPISLNFWVELVGACNSIWYQSQMSRVRVLAGALIKIITAHSNIHVCGLGECWGSWPSEASPASGQAGGFSSRAASVMRKDCCDMGLTETLMLLMSREFCCAGMVLHGGASLRCRRHRWLRFGDEGSRGPGPRCVARARCPERCGATRAGSPLRCRRCSAPGHVAAADV